MTADTPAVYSSGHYIAMAYTNDVFISYKRDPFRDEWLVEHFMPMFSSFVREEIAKECGRRPERIFFDQAEVSAASRTFDQYGIEPGQEWKNALGQALKTSRCLVALWSPLYFFSEWCLIEWESFRQRVSTGDPLVIPMSVHDGEAFPSLAKNLQAPDFSEFVIVGPAFREMRAYPTFQQKVRAFAGTVARRVAHAPPFADFPLAPAATPPASAPQIPQQRL